MASEGVVQIPPDSTGKTLRTATGGVLSPASTTHQHVHTLADAEGFLAKVSNEGALQVENLRQVELLTVIVLELRRIGLLLSVLTGTEIATADLLEGEP